MEKKYKTPPFPQANDLSKILLLVKLEQEYLFDNTYLEEKLALTRRQVNYYISACNFLGILDKKRLFTKLGISLKRKSTFALNVAISQIIVSKPVFGEVFFNKLFANETLSIETISELISCYYEVDSVSVADRRASTVKNWINWIFNNISKGNYYSFLNAN